MLAEGYDLIWTGDWPQDPGDEAILSHAVSTDRILVTLDKDFGELAIIHGRPHCGIERLVNLAARQQAQALIQVLKRHGSALAAGAIVTIEPGRLRIRQTGPK